VLTVGGQCEGYGGMFEALRTLIPVAHAWYAETDPDASAVLAHHYPGVKNLGDITAVDWRDVDPVDILTSGFPCQPMSNAGPRLGAADPRHLWPTGVLPAIEILRPSLVILENVRGLLTIDDGAVFGRVVADLDAAGYVTSWAVVGACLVGACHHRHRVFLVATSADTAVTVPDPAPIAARRGRTWQALQTVLFGEPDPAPKWPAAGLVAGGRVWPLPAVVCAGKAAALPTPIARDAIRGAWRGDRPGRPLSEVVALLPTVRASDVFGAGRHGDGGLDLRTAVALLPSSQRFGGYAAAVRRHELAYGRAAPAPTTPGCNGQPRLSARFVEWMQGLSPGWLTDVVGFQAAVRMAGNGVNPRQCAYAVASSPVFRCWARRNAPGANPEGVSVSAGA